MHQLSSGSPLVINCQADLLQHLNTRLVVPLMEMGQAPKAAHRLNPVFTIGGREHVMVTQFAAAVQLSELGDFVISLRDRSFDVVNALDVLISGV